MSGPVGAARAARPGSPATADAGAAEQLAAEPIAAGSAPEADPPPEAGRSRGADTYPEALASGGGFPRDSWQHRIILLLICLAAAAIQFTYTSRGWFYLDDFRNLGDAHRDGVTLHFLASPIGNEHFQPGGRLLHWLAGIGGHPHFHFGEAILAASVASMALLTARTADELFGVRRLHLVLAALIGTSYTLVVCCTWYAGSDAIPATAFMAATLLLYARWFRRGGGYRLVGAVLCAGAGVLFWEQAIILPFLLVLLWACFLRAGASRPVWQLALSIAPFALVSVAFDAYVSAQSWYQPLVVPSAGQFTELVRTMLLRGMLPPIVGWRVSTQPPDRSGIASMVLAAGILLSGALVLLWRRRFRWSAVAFFVPAFLALAATIAVTRIAVGPLVGATPRYLCPLPMLLALTVAGAAGRCQLPPGAQTTSRLRVRPRLAVAAGLTVLLGAGYLAALTDSVRATSFARLNGKHAHTISDRVSRALHPGMTDLVDTRLRWPIFYTSNDGADEVSTLSPFWAPGVQAIGAGPNPIAIAPDGSAHRIRFAAGQAGPALYLRLVVLAAQPGTLTVTIHGIRPLEPNRPYSLRLRAGSSSFILPAWARAVRSIELHAPAGATVTVRELGTITLTGPAG
ncbi:MAG TPA: hypothetical protein VHO01_16590 [Jatrophihabitans sp.]|nr:hypothetical protein [Jatrophihabitans sp.]